MPLPPVSRKSGLSHHPSENSCVSREHSSKARPAESQLPTLSVCDVVGQNQHTLCVFLSPGKAARGCWLSGPTAAGWLSSRAGGTPPPSDATSPGVPFPREDARTPTRPGHLLLLGLFQGLTAPEGGTVRRHFSSRLLGACRTERMNSLHERWGLCQLRAEPGTPVGTGELTVQPCSAQCASRPGKPVGGKATPPCGARGTARGLVSSLGVRDAKP